MNASMAAAEFGYAVQDVATNRLSGVRRQLGRARKGQVRGVDSLVPVALAIVSLAIVVGIGVVVLAEMNAAVDNNNSTAVLNTAINAMDTFANFFTVIIIIAVAAVLFILLQVVRRAGSSASA